ncbi:MAG: ABC transporter substrate-binding protein [Alphaproteobacteria bacterium]|nr:ABC transporter substrate-binding protein [Alphaproteobacteria bacterium]
MIRKIWIMVLFAVIAAALVCFLIQGRNMDTGKPVVKIGLVLPLTGNSAHLGQAIKGAAEVAVAHANRNSDNRYDYKIVAEDSMLQMPIATRVTSKMISTDHIDALISFSAEVVNVVSSIAEKNKIIHFGISVDKSGATGKYNFINWTMPESSTAKMTEQIKAKGFKNVAVVSFNQSGALANSEMLDKKLRAVGIKSTLYRFNGDIRNFKTDIQKMQDAKTELYVLRLFDPQMSIFIKQLRETGDKSTISSIEMFNAIADPSIIESLWFVDTATAENDITREIMKYNKSEVTWGLGQVYDNVMMIVRAFEIAPDKVGAIDVLIDTKEFDGTVGRLKQDKDGIFHSVATIKRIENGKQVIVK